MSLPDGVLYYYSRRYKGPGTGWEVDGGNGRLLYARSLRKRRSKQMKQGLEAVREDR